MLLLLGGGVDPRHNFQYQPPAGLILDMMDDVNRRPSLLKFWQVFGVYLEHLAHTILMDTHGTCDDF